MTESGESLNWERSCSPTIPTQIRGTTSHTMAPSTSGASNGVGTRRLPLTSPNGTHVVIHEYAGSTLETTLFLGDRLHIVDNGDPDWLHAFKVKFFFLKFFYNFSLIYLETIVLN